MPKHFPILLALLLCLAFLSACAGPSQFGQVEETLSQAAGKMTYAQAVERWGQPTALDRGETHFTAYWLKPGTFVDEKLFLTFDNRREILRSYRYLQKPFE